ncbi:hypothetical protein [Nocardiopsis sp. L17-MgMaSL7]|nr:hypothetical protein [Nocardiopsis sp. L17-MgMaSL7]PWV54673.1 hypothetical protein BDW27_104135 [Nocardiopsis sp. L17-MgMaSL7]
MRDSLPPLSLDQLGTEAAAGTVDTVLAAFDAAVTDWELFRGFERM